MNKFQVDNSGLSDDVIFRIQGVLESHPHVEQAILYGSRAKGTYNKSSDIDLTLKGRGLDFSELALIDNELDDLLLPYTFDLSIYHQIDNPDLIDHINSAGKEFYRR